MRYRGLNIPEVYDQRDALLEAAKLVIARWSSGDLAGAVNQLEEAVNMNTEASDGSKI
jgi:hypothetical protein